MLVRSPRFPNILHYMLLDLRLHCGSTLWIILGGRKKEEIISSRFAGRHSVDEASKPEPRDSVFKGWQTLAVKTCKLQARAERATVQGIGPVAYPFFPHRGTIS